MDSINTALASWLEKGGKHMGQVAILANAMGWTLCNEADLGRTDLSQSSRWEDARKLANFDDFARFRPLKTAPTLRTGWSLQLPNIESVRFALDYFYPGMLGIWHSFGFGKLNAINFRDTLGRQTGMYRVNQKINDSEANTLIARTCRLDGGCLKRILWKIAPDQPITTLPPEKFNPSPSLETLPLICSEACNILVAEARKVVKAAEPPK